jgi:ribosomal protein L12E/L44/L45/RPP1/RPP2
MKAQSVWDHHLLIKEEFLVELIVIPTPLCPQVSTLMVGGDKEEEEEEEEEEKEEDEEEEEW